jgi:hypothetical protein
VSCRRILEIYVAPDCFGCETARDLAGMLHARGWPHLEVRLLDLSQPHVTRPAAVFAVPTYILDGRVISLGNPEEGWLLDQVAPSSPGAADDAHHICHPTQAR